MLATKSLSFSFSLKVGNNFSFSMESRGEGALSPQKKKKKTTPSALRRNARRREEFLNKKLAPAAEANQQEVSVEEAKEDHQKDVEEVQQRAEHCNTSGVDIASSQLPNPEVIDCEECGEVFKCGEDLEEHTLWCPRCYVFSCLTLNSSSTNCLGCSKPYTLPPKEVCLLLQTRLEGSGEGKQVKVT